MRTSENAVVVAVVLGWATVATAQTDFQWRGPISPGQTLEVQGINGDIHATASASLDAEVTAAKSARRSNPADVRIEVVPHAGGVTICAVYSNTPGESPNRCEPGGSHSHVRDNDTTVRFEVRVPTGATFVGRTVNGSIDGESLGGDAEAHTVNGSVRLSTTGLALAHTVNGSLNVTTGRADWPNGATFSAVNGNVTLNVPAFLSANVRASVVNGTIASDLPITATGQISPRRLEGTIGSGGQQLTLSTVNGNVNLLKIP
jgi:DUF4097 and DUF4098 domain-containing protein YvlB